MGKPTRRRKLVMGVAVALSVLGALEIVLRLTWPEGRYFHWTPDIQAGVPITRNSRGFRGPDPHPRVAGEIRVLCLGDSTTLGMGEEEQDTWPARLEQLLNERHPGRRFVTMNAAGLGGFPHASLDAWPQYEALDPDLVLYLMCENDVVVRRPSMPVVPGGPAPERRARFRFALFTSRLSRLRIAGAAKYLGRSVAPLDLPTLLDYLPDEFYTTGYGPPELIEQAWQDTGESLVSIAARARAHGADFALMLLPYRFLLSEEPRDDHFKLREATFLTDPAPRIETIAARGGFPFRDLTPVFRETRRAMMAGEIPYDPLFQPFDYCHPNAQGYRVIAEAALPLAESLGAAAR